MNFSFLSPDFALFVGVSVPLLTLSRGEIRQAVFLALNLFFVWRFVLSAEEIASTVAFCLIGYALTRLHMRWNWLRISYTLPFFVALFLYMRNYEMLHWILPESVLTSVLSTIGLSFLFFKIIHVIVDAKGGMLGKFDFLTYLNYCLNFTTFVMGPIQRYQDYSEQWNGRKQAIELTFEAHLDAVLRIMLGMVKSYVLAELFHPFALRPETDLLALDLPALMVQVYSFFFFLYLNFSGYCDVVIGVGSLFGVRPPENFDKPFIAQNISDFWLRQHRSLTLWLTDYVFSPAYKKGLESASFQARPLGAGNLALVLTMLVSGIWHGTTVGFLLFGMVHGLYLVIYHTWDYLLTRACGKARVMQFRKNWLARLIGIGLTFNAASFAFIFFQIDAQHLLGSSSLLISLL